MIHLVATVVLFGKASGGGGPVSFPQLLLGLFWFFASFILGCFLVSLLFSYLPLNWFLRNVPGLTEKEFLEKHPVKAPEVIFWKVPGVVLSFIIGGFFLLCQFFYYSKYPPENPLAGYFWVFLFISTILVGMHISVALSEIIAGITTSFPLGRGGKGGKELYFVSHRARLIGVYRLLVMVILVAAWDFLGYWGQPLLTTTSLIASGPPPGTKPGEVFTNSLGMKFAWIPPGQFLMGSPSDEQDRGRSETQYQVTLTKGFYLGIYEVTQEQWQAVMGNNPSYFQGDKDLPVERVSWGGWDGCQEFIRRLSHLEGRQYRLPTEAEWEFACRAGTTTVFFFGNDAGQLGDYAWYEDNSGNRTHPVGQKKPNAWGLFDMQGNVREWCQDWFGDYRRRAGEGVDPQGLERGLGRVCRGGNSTSLPGDCRSASRNWFEAGSHSRRTGFRLALNPPSGPASKASK